MLTSVVGELVHTYLFFSGISLSKLPGSLLKDLKSEDDLRNDDDLQNEDDLKNEDNLKNENDLNMKTTSI